MAEFAQRLFDCRFALGATRYVDYYPGDELNARIVLLVSLAGVEPLSAIVDTGAPWCIFDPEALHAAGVNTAPATDDPIFRVNIRGIVYQGYFIRLPVQINADVGQGLSVEATVFVPLLAEGETWEYPNFLGLSGFLSRLRFALDPADNTFYFGPIS